MGSAVIQSKAQEAPDPTDKPVELFDAEARVVCRRNMYTRRCDVKNAAGELQLSASLPECKARWPKLKPMVDLDYCERAVALSV